MAGLDIKSEGGYIVAPPSLHASGQRYCWEDEAVPIAPLPEGLAKRLIVSERHAEEEPEHDNTTIREGHRNTALASLADKLRAQGMNQVEIEAALLACNARRCEPPLDEAEVAEIAASISRYPVDEKRGASTATHLVALASEAELFHAPDGEVFATISVSGHHETWPLKAEVFKRWLARQFYGTAGIVPNSQAMQDALTVLKGCALYEGPEHQLFVRVAGVVTGGAEAIYLDLANERWEAVEITPHGWKVIGDPPVRFRRMRGMRPLPNPARGGTIDELRPYVNIASEADWRLMVAWLVAAFRPRGPFPILILQGEQGTAKSTTARLLRMLVDPSTVPLRTIPREERDLMIAAANGWTLVFDNLSGLAPWMADAVCRLATGGGLATRELYTDADEALFDAVRPVILNGIDEIAPRPNLADRSLILTLPQIREGVRRAERDFWRAFEAVWPRVFGALLDAVSVALRTLPQVQLAKLPRMADFAEWATAAESALGWPERAFMQAYAGNQEEAVEAALEADVVAGAVRNLIAHQGEWSGTASELLAQLEMRVAEPVRRTHAWPKTARALLSHLRRAATFLRAVGIEVDKHRAGGQRLISIGHARNGGESSVTTGTSVKLPHERWAEADLDPMMQTRGVVTQTSARHGSASSADAVSDRVLDASDGRDGGIPPHSDVVSAQKGEPAAQTGARVPATSSVAGAPNVVPLAPARRHQPTWWPRVEELMAQGVREQDAIGIALHERDALPRDDGGVA